MENNSLNLENREGYSRDSLPPLSVLIWSLRQGVLAAGSRDKTSPLIPEDLDRGLGDRLAWFSRHTTASTRKSARRDAGGKVKKRKQKEGDSRWASRLPKLQHGWPRPRAASVTAFNDLCNNESHLSKIFATMRWTVDNCKVAVSVFRTRARDKLSRDTGFDFKLTRGGLKFQLKLRPINQVPRPGNSIRY